MPGLFSRLKTWLQDEKLLFSDLNNEFNNIISNCDTDHIGGASSALANMQAVENPGVVGSEVFGPSISATDEIERLRFVIQRLIGGTKKWYEVPSSDITTLTSYLSGSGTASANRIVSGKVNAYGMPAYIWGNASSRKVTVKGVSTPLAYSVNGALFSLVADVDSPTVSAPPATNNTCTTVTSLTNMKTYQIDPTSLRVASLGANFSAQVGKWIAFSGGSEYMVGYLKDATIITNITRYGWVDATGAAVLPSGWTSSPTTTLTLQRIFFIFLTNTQTVEVTENNPVYSPTAPTSPSFGDMWYDTANYTWKKWSGTVWNASNSIFIGTGIATSTGCVAVRSLDFTQSYSPVNTLDLVYQSATSVSTRQTSTRVSVYGTDLNEPQAKLVWDVSTGTPFEGGSVGNNQVYFYVTPSGSPLLSLYAPVDRRSTLGGWYHIFAPYRCLGSATVTLGSITASSVVSVEPQKTPMTTSIFGNPYNPFGKVNFAIGNVSGNYTGSYTQVATCQIAPIGQPIRVSIGLNGSGAAALGSSTLYALKITASITDSGGTSAYTVGEATFATAILHLPTYVCIDQQPMFKDETAVVTYTLYLQSSGGTGTTSAGYSLIAEAIAV